MLPIPTHLANIFIPMGNDNNEFHVDGVIRCSCGYECFHIKIYANTEEGHPQVCEYEDGYALVIKAVCMDCGKEHLIFDDSKHGWNGFICHEGITVPDDKLENWNCPKCSYIYTILKSLSVHRGKKILLMNLALPMAKQNLMRAIG